MSHFLTAHLVVPVANAEDARATATALEECPYNRITVVHVVEKGGGVPDKIPLEQARSRAEDSFAAFREIVPNVETEITYATDVVKAINELAVELEVDAIAFRPRGGNRIVQLLAGDKALRLVTEAELPVIAVHDGAEVNH
ncbi:universal stress protein [Natrinema gari]|uniref:Universal stress protein n=1 Tax=Natrinema gari JCM 14663 TaxID=1230459 RepID=L9ZBA6_9EURY|nr:universal stress protein [Natrinema gari]ELY82892.1 universal stress protein [Natrinema gari JCM 14663]